MVKIDFEKLVIRLQINFAFVLAFAAFWSYGIFGAISRKDAGMLEAFIFSIILCGIFILFLYLIEYNRKFFSESLEINIKDIIIFFSLLLILLIFSYSNLSNSINNDQLAHAQQSQLHGMTFISLVSKFTSFFDTWRYDHLLYYFNLAAFILGIFILFMLKKIYFKYKIILLPSVFLLFRGIVVFLGGSGSPHPPLRLFPLWFSSIFFGVNDFSFRFSSFIGLIIFMWMVHRIISKKIGDIYSYFIVLTVGTIPLLWHVGILAEQSFWTAMISTLFLITLFIDNKIHYMRWFSLLSIFTMMRLSGFILFVPLLILYIIDIYKDKNRNTKEILMTLSPLLLMLPFLLFAIFAGTPVIKVSTEYNSSFSRIWGAFTSGIMYNAALNSVLLPWFAFIFFSFIAFIKEGKKTFILFITFLMGLCIFYALSPGVWGVGRYQSEILIPFSILGLLVIVQTILNYKVHRFLIIPFLTLLIIFNMWEYKNIPSQNLPVDKLVVVIGTVDKELGSYRILSEFPYDYNIALSEVKKTGLAGHEYIAGVTYGIFPEILSGFTVAEIAEAKRNYKPDLSAEEINKDSNIRIVLISDLARRDLLSQELKDLGWYYLKDFKNQEYGSSILAFIRK